MKARGKDQVTPGLLGRGASRRLLLANIGSNYVAALWMAGLSLALVPWYLHRLGADQWGIIALSLSLQAVLTLLDSGLGQIMPRDVARVSQEPSAIARVFRRFSTAYLLLAVIGFLTGQALVAPVVEFWIRPRPEILTETVLAMRIVLVQFLFQFANSAHQGFWNGMQQQSVAGLRQCLFATAKHATAVASITWHPAVLAYLLSFALISMAEYLANRHSILTRLPRLESSWATASDLGALGREASVLGLGVIVGMLLSQTDRIVLSGLVDVASFGRYAIVASFGLAFMQLQMPVARAFLPRMVEAHRLGHGRATTQMAAAVVVLCVIPCGIAMLVAPELLSFWVRDTLVASQGTLPFRLILAAVALNAIYQIWYQRILVRGEPNLILRINVLIAMVVLPGSPFVVGRYGIVGGGVIWLTISTLQVLLGVVFVRRGAR